ncbi:MAG: PQQ-dependent sugar dehydrogenase [Terrimicrobiaceae bacterium]|nr:PQQ-dependent sugar dehydrogenase [Terrimicrobiaceae bacterium]
MLLSAGWLGAQQPEVIASERARFKIEVLADGLDHPWGMVKLPDGRFLVTERPGRLRVIAGGKLLPEPIKGIPPVFARGQGGLLDIQLHPDYAKNGWIYLSLADPQGDKGLTKVIRGRIKDGVWVDQQTIFQAPADQYVPGGNHFGCRMQFDGKGFLFFSVGERGDVTTPANNAQKLTNVKGKIHRLRDDGKVPMDNPFYKTPGATQSIWSWGHRNPQGLHFDRYGTLWEAEHGPRGGDELNVIRKGLNYGWPLVTFGINYSGTPITDKTSAPGMESPVIHWTPSIAVGGIDFYHGSEFPAWNGNLFATALAHQKLVRMEIDASNHVTHQEILLEKTGRMRDIRCYDDGSLYLIYDDPGKIVRLVPAGG